MSDKGEGPTRALMIYAFLVLLLASSLFNKFVCNPGTVVKADKVAIVPDQKGR